MESASSNPSAPTPITAAWASPEPPASRCCTPFADAGGHRAIVYSRGDAAYPIPKRLYGSSGFTAYTRTHTYVGTPTG
jgi:hypothetical protein